MNERIGLASTAGERGNNRCMKLISRGTVYCRVGSSSPYQFTDAVCGAGIGTNARRPLYFFGIYPKDAGLRLSSLGSMMRICIAIGGNMTTRVLLADDHSLFAQAVASMLRERYEIVDIVSDGRALQAALRQHKPDVAIVDITMPLMSGLDSIRTLGKDHWRPKIIFLTMHADPELAGSASSAAVLDS
jgi:CheY-like chemotaxis protein